MTENTISESVMMNDVHHYSKYMFCIPHKNSVSNVDFATSVYNADMKGTGSIYHNNYYINSKFERKTPFFTKITNPVQDIADKKE